MTSTPTTHAPVRDAHRSLWLPAAVAGIFLIAVLLLMVGVNMRRGLNHDEHQFVASGVLLARQGLLPYRDFPYFHVPHLTLIYAALFQASDYLLLSARSFSVAASWSMVTLLLFVALSWLRNLTLWVRLATGMATVLLLISTPNFLHASGRAWNQDLPVLLSLAAAVVTGAWLTQRHRAPGWLAGAGLLIGLATGTRLTYALLVVPFAAAILWRDSPRSLRAWRNLASFGVGMCIGLLPTLVFFVLAPQQFIFGNLTYATLNTAYYRQLADPDAAMTLVQKLAQTGQFIAREPATLLLMALTILALWRVRREMRWSAAPELVFLLALLPFLLAGAFAPTPLQLQYVYPLLPFASLLFLAALARDPAPIWPVRLVSGAALIGVILALPRFSEGMAVVFAPAAWEPLKLHARGEIVMDLAEGSDVLTLAPIEVLEGRGQIDPALVTGALAWRVAPLLSVEERRAYGIKSLAELRQEIDAQPPGAILTGVHDDDTAAEAPLLAFAADHGYVPVTLPEEATLWLAPIARWGDGLQLGAAQLPDGPVAPGAEVLATFYVQATRRLDRDLNVLVRLVDVAGAEIARSEGWPWGRPTSSWPVGAVWPDGHKLQIPATTQAGPLRVAMSFYDPQTLELLDAEVTAGYLVVAAPVASSPQVALATFDDTVRLVTVDLSEAVWIPGTTVPIAVTWETAKPLERRYTVFMHLIDASGRLVAQADQEPFGGFYPTDRWLANVAMQDTHRLTLPDDLPSGDYTLLVGLYDAATGDRLPLAGAPSVDAYHVGPISIP